MAETLSSLQDLANINASAQPEAPVHVQKLDAQGRAYATGKRKDAVARVWIKPGSGKITVNARAFDVYFARPVLRMIVQQPLGIVGRANQYDLTITVAGGGLSGQAVADAEPRGSRLAGDEDARRHDASGVRAAAGREAHVRTLPRRVKAASETALPQEAQRRGDDGRRAHHQRVGHR